jgi:predicted metal-dependent hydrolase
VDDAERLIHRKKTWVLDTLSNMQEKRKVALDVKKNRLSVLLFGKEKGLVFKFNQKRDFILETKDNIVMGVVGARIAKKRIEAKLEFWLAERASRYFPLRLRKLNNNQFDVGLVTVKNHKTLWGSCSSKGNINLNWRMIMAPKFVSDYIVFHEMCHTKHMNHSKRYWALVSEVCPSYERAEEWIRKYGFLLHVNLFGFGE